MALARRQEAGGTSLPPTFSHPRALPQFSLPLRLPSHSSAQGLRPRLVFPHASRACYPDTRDCLGASLLIFQPPAACYPPCCYADLPKDESKVPGGLAGGKASGACTPHCCASASLHNCVVVPFKHRRRKGAMAWRSGSARGCEGGGREASGACAALCPPPTMRLLHAALLHAFVPCAVLLPTHAHKPRADVCPRPALCAPKAPTARPPPLSPLPLPPLRSQRGLQSGTLPA